MEKMPLVEPGIHIEEETSQANDLERLYRVLIHNDDVTPYDFVIIALVRFFRLAPPDAELITLTAHTSGSAQVVIMPLSEAQRCVGRAHFAASLEGFPLTFTIEPE